MLLQRAVTPITSGREGAEVLTPFRPTTQINTANTTHGHRPEPELFTSP
jgi:hypothetical protein